MFDILEQIFFQVPTRVDGVENISWGDVRCLSIQGVLLIPACFTYGVPTRRNKKSTSNSQSIQGYRVIFILCHVWYFSLFCAFSREWSYRSPLYLFSLWNKDGGSRSVRVNSCWLGEGTRGESVVSPQIISKI